MKYNGLIDAVTMKPYVLTLTGCVPDMKPNTLTKRPNDVRPQAVRIRREEKISD